MRDFKGDSELLISGDLVLSALSEQVFPAIKTYHDIKKIDLQGVKNIDSAGIAYLAQIKTTYSNIQFCNAADKIATLSALYGVGFLFQE